MAGVYISLPPTPRELFLMILGRGGGEIWTSKGNHFILNDNFYPKIS